MISKFVFALFAIMMNTLQICKINTAEQTQEDNTDCKVPYKLKLYASISKNTPGYSYLLL